MMVKKSGGKITGMHLTNAEQKALDIEVQKALAVYEKQFAQELDALILYQLHTQCGFGPQRLRRFYEGFIEGHQELIERYEMGTADLSWLATEKLKEIGVDVVAWNKEKHPYD